MNFAKNTASLTLACAGGERNEGGIQTTIDTCPDTTWIHAPPHVEESMTEKHSRRQLGIFECHMTTHAPSERRVREETDGAWWYAPTVIRREKELKNWLITVWPLTPWELFCPFRGLKWWFHCSKKYKNKINRPDEPDQAGPKTRNDRLDPQTRSIFCPFRGTIPALHYSWAEITKKKWVDKLARTTGSNCEWTVTRSHNEQ